MIMVRGLQVQEDMKSNVKVNMWISLNKYQWCKPIEYLIGFEKHELKQQQTCCND